MEISFGKKPEKKKQEYAGGVEQVFRDHRVKKLAQEYRKTKPVLLKAGIIAGIFLLLVIYYFLPVSRVRAVSVTGSQYLDPSYIAKESQVSLKNRYYMVIPALVERRLEKDPMIEKAEVTLADGNVIHINVVEKQPFGYRYEEEPMILFTDNTKAVMKSEYLDIIARIPMISGFEDDEQTRLLADAFEKVDRSVVEDMSEISQIALSYDDQTMCILMRNGGYFITNYYNLEKINSYNKIYSSMRDKSYCIWATIKGSNISTAEARACPWDEEVVELEYWTDENGDVITNIYGDKAARHYYKDEEGKDVLDPQGNPIVIPIGSDGLDIVDEHFQEHYEAGYYDTGELILPDSGEDGEESGEETGEDGE